MSSILQINIRDLLYCSGVESARVEFKASWHEATTGWQVIKTICAFANDLQNQNGGYIVIGVAENDGKVVLPPNGISHQVAESAGKWIRTKCRHCINPMYQPVFSPEIIDEKTILVIWVPGSDMRPHQASDGEKAPRKYFVRIGSESVDASQNGVLEQLIQMTVRVPFDDRRASNATIEDIREAKVREFLKDIDSGLLEENDTKTLYRKFRIAGPVNGHDSPKNIGLLFFSENADTWFPGAKIEVVQFAGGTAGNVIEEKTFFGGIHEQLKNVLSYLETISSSYIEKQDNSFRVKGWVSYPIQALREAVVNAVYHRSYDPSVQEPIKVYLYPNRIEITSYPGPVQGIEQVHLEQKEPIPPVPARNRRIGELLKELKLAEGRGTGLPKLFRAMKENGSGEPTFDFDEGRTYFRVTLPAHPEYIAISALRDAAHLRAIGNETDAYRRISETWKQMPASPTITAEYLRLLGKNGNITDAEKVFSEFKSKTSDGFIPFVTNVLIEILLESQQKDKAAEYLTLLPQYLASNDALDAAILARRMGKEKDAHRYFERAGDALLHNTRAVHEFAQTKIDIARELHRQRGNTNANHRLLSEAKELLERVTQMEADPTRHAWAWRGLAQVKTWLRSPYSEIEKAYQRAIELLPSEQRFQNEFQRWKQQHQNR